MQNSGILAGYKWCREISNVEEKETLGRQVAELVRDGQVIGAGAGSSVYVALSCLSARVKSENLRVTVIPAAYETRLACASFGLPAASLIEQKPDWCFDGADEIDPAGSVIKGRGGALFAEKLIIASCASRYLLADRSKFVAELGRKFPVPVEVFPNAVHLAENELYNIGAAEVKLRLAREKDGPVVTEAGNFLLDCRFERIGNTLEKDIKSIPGVIESGLFQGYSFIYIK